MNRRKLSNWMIAVLIALASSLAVAAEFSDDFSGGLDSTYWEVEATHPNFLWDDNNGKVCFSSPEGGSGTSYELITLSFNCEIVGDFDVLVEFSDASIEHVNDGHINTVSLHTVFGDQNLIVNRSHHRDAGDEAAVWLDPPFQSFGVIPWGGTSGELGVTRSESDVSARIDDTVLIEDQFNDRPLTVVYFSLESHNTIDPISVCFDNVTVVADEIICDDLSQGLVARYPLNGSAEDTSGQGNHGTVNGANLTVDRFMNQDSAYLFDGEDDFIRVLQSDSLDITGTLTMAAWILAETIDPTQGYIAVVEKEESAMGYNMHLTHEQKLHVRLDGTSVNAGDVLTDRWHFLTAVYEGDFIKTFIDAVQVGQVFERLPTHVADKDLNIGSWNTERFFDGIIDDVRIFDRALSKREISALYLEENRSALPAVARVQGTGAFFTSKWNLFNSSSRDIVIELTYTPRQDMGGEQRVVEYTVSGGSLLEVVDPLAEIFSITDNAVGSVIVDVIEGLPQDVMIQSAVFAQKDDGLEFGQFFPARRLLEGLFEGDTAYVSTTSDPLHNRVNLGLLATTNDTRIEVTPVQPIGSALAESRRYNLDSGESRQLNNIHAIFDLGSTADVLLEVEMLRGAALVYGSVVDGKGEYAGTSDPTTIQPVANGALEVVLLELGSVQGYNEFSGSAIITNLSTTAADVTVDFCERSSPGISATTSLTIEAGTSIGFADLVGDLIGIEDTVGTVILTSNNGTLLSATGREFAIFRDDDGNITGTAGQLMDGLTAYDMLEPARTYHFIGLRQVESGDSLERSHIAFFNPGDSRIEATMKLYADDGQLEGTWTRSVRAMELVHVNNIINRINSSQDGEVKRLEVTVNGPVFARAFRVNPYGDPITIEPFTR